MKSSADLSLIHCRLNELLHIIYWKSNFDFRYVRLCDLNISREKWLNYLQTVDLIRCHILHVWTGSALFANKPFRVSRLQWVNVCSFYCMYMDILLQGYSSKSEKPKHTEQLPVISLTAVCVFSLSSVIWIFSAMWTYSFMKANLTWEDSQIMSMSLLRHMILSLDLIITRLVTNRTRFQRNFTALWPLKMILDNKWSCNKLFFIDLVETFWVTFNKIEVTPSFWVNFWWFLLKWVPRFPVDAYKNCLIFLKYNAAVLKVIHVYWTIAFLKTNLEYLEKQLKYEHFNFIIQNYENSAMTTYFH